MPSTPRVSVVMPVWNGATTLARAIASIRAQTFTDWELLVIDDGSTDDSAALARAVATEDSRVRLISREHGGVVAASATGLAAARGELLARLDSDDESRPERLAKQVALLDAQPAIGLCATQVDFGGDAVAQRGYALHVAWTNSRCTPAEISTARFIDAPVAHPSVMFRREVLERHGGYRAHAWPEDYELWLRWLDAGVQFAKVPEPLVVWHDPPTRLSRTHPLYAPEAFYSCKCHYLARWLQTRVAGQRPVFLWGAGRPTRRRFAALADGGIRLAAYVDVDVKKVGGRADGRPVIGAEALPPPGECFVIAGVATRGARELIAAELTSRGFVEGRDWIAAA